jgi:hypothetical protein
MSVDKEDKVFFAPASAGPVRAPGSEAATQAIPGDEEAAGRIAQKFAG